VTHYGVSGTDIETTVQAVRSALDETGSRRTKPAPSLAAAAH